MINLLIVSADFKESAGGGIRRCKSKDRQYKRKRTNGQIMIYKTLHRKLKSKQKIDMFTCLWLTVVSVMIQLS
jgi:hypothetical protein